MTDLDDLSSVKWKSYDATILENLHSYYVKESLCDATIVCEGKLFRIHKLIMSLSSDYFSEIFSQTPPWNQPYIVITGINATNMAYILTYIYSGEISVSQVELPSFLVAAECLKIKRLDSSPENLPSAALPQSVKTNLVANQNEKIPIPTKIKRNVSKQTSSSKRPMFTFEQSSKKQKISSNNEEDIIYTGEDEHIIDELQTTNANMRLINVNIIRVKQENDDIMRLNEGNDDIMRVKQEINDNDVMVKPECDEDYTEYCSPEDEEQMPSWTDDLMDDPESPMNMNSNDSIEDQENEEFLLPVKREILDDSYEFSEVTNQQTAPVMKPSYSITSATPNITIHSTSITLHPNSRTSTSKPSTSKPEPTRPCTDSDDSSWNIKKSMPFTRTSFNASPIEPTAAASQPLAIKSLKAQVSKLRSKLEKVTKIQQETFLLVNEQRKEYTSVASPIKTNFPASNMDELDILLNDDCLIALLHKQEEISLRSTVRSMLRLILSPDLISLFSFSGMGSGRKRTKVAFKNHKIYKVLNRSLLLTIYKTVPKREIDATLKVILKNSCDWQGKKIRSMCKESE